MERKLHHIYAEFVPPRSAAAVKAVLAAVPKDATIIPLPTPVGARTRHLKSGVRLVVQWGLMPEPRWVGQADVLYAR